MKDDLISRQAVIDAIEWGKTYLSVFDKDGNVSRPFEVANNELSNAIDRIKEIPSAQDWIPVTERLPEAEDMYQPPEQRYLCQLEAYGERKFCVLSRLKGAVSPFWDWYGVAVRDHEVTAWMPLPEPYKEADR